VCVSLCIYYCVCLHMCLLLYGLGVCVRINFSGCFTCHFQWSHARRCDSMEVGRGGLVRVSIHNKVLNHTHVREEINTSKHTCNSASPLCVFHSVPLPPDTGTENRYTDTGIAQTTHKKNIHAHAQTQAHISSHTYAHVSHAQHRQTHTHKHKTHSLARTNVTETSHTKVIIHFWCFWTLVVLFTNVMSCSHTHITETSHTKVIMHCWYFWTHILSCAHMHIPEAVRAKEIYIA